MKCKVSSKNSQRINDFKAISLSPAVNGWGVVWTGRGEGLKAATGEGWSSFLPIIR